MASTVPAPRIGDTVHYVSYGTPGGEYGQECRAAVVTQVGDDTIGLCVLNPTGQFFNPSIRYSDGGETPGRYDCGMKDTHGDPHRYCSCGWIEAAYKGGTWHPIH